MKTEYLPTICARGNTSEWSSPRKPPLSEVLADVWIPETASIIELSVGRPCLRTKNKQCWNITDRDNNDNIGETKGNNRSLRFARHLTRSFVVHGRNDGKRERSAAGLPGLRLTVPLNSRGAPGESLTLRYMHIAVLCLTLSDVKVSHAYGYLQHACALNMTANLRDTE
jgi:hypothetical protein